jgi:hypothetical protein
MFTQRDAWGRDYPGIDTVEEIKNRILEARPKFHRGISERQREALELYAWSLTFSMKGISDAGRDTIAQMVDELINAYLFEPGDHKRGERATEALLHFLETDHRH